MSREDLSANFLDAIYSQETNEVFLALLVIDSDDPDWTVPIRVVNNTTNIFSNGSTYLGFPFQITLPSELEDQMPTVTLVISNIDRQITEGIREIDARHDTTVSLSVILASSPDTVELGPFTMALREVEYDMRTVTATLQPEDILTEPYPGDIFSPSNYPGLFK